MLYELRRFQKPSISTENNVAQNALWLHSVFSNYGGKTKFQLVYSSKYLRYLSMATIEMKVILLEVEYFST